MSQPTPRDDAPAAPADGADGMNQGMQVLSYLIAGVVLYGGVGWGLDHLLGTGFLLPIGIVLGAGFGVYLVIMRFGVPPAVPAPRQRGRTRGTPTSSRTEEGTT